MEKNAGIFFCSLAAPSNLPAGYLAESLHRAALSGQQVEKLHQCGTPVGDCKLSDSGGPEGFYEVVGVLIPRKVPHFKGAVSSGKVKYLDTLLIKAAAKISKAGTRSSTPENGIGNLVTAGIINTPDYWLAHYHDYPSLGALLCALGGAVN